MLILNLKLLFYVLEVLESGLHFRDFNLGTIELVVYMISFVITAGSFDDRQLIGLIGLKAFFLVMGPEGLVIKVSSEVGFASVHH